jgi:hypothetical protein
MAMVEIAEPLFSFPFSSTEWMDGWVMMAMLVAMARGMDGYHAANFKMY